MTILDELTKEIDARTKHCVDPAELAQAAWDIVKAEMLGDDVMFEAGLGYLGSNWGADSVNLVDLKAALTAAMQKMEEGKRDITKTQQFNN